jgi:uncharacterized membrane protein
MSMIEKILNRFCYEKTDKPHSITSSFDDARKSFLGTLSDVWEDKVAMPRRERKYKNQRSGGYNNSSSAQGWSWPSLDWSGGGDSGGGDGGGGGGGE